MRPRVANLHPFKEDVEMSIGDPLTVLNFQHWATGEQEGKRTRERVEVRVAEARRGYWGEVRGGAVGAGVKS